MEIPRGPPTSSSMFFILGQHFSCEAHKQGLYSNFGHLQRSPWGIPFLIKLGLKTLPYM